MQEIKFKVGDMVKILSEDRTFGWDDEMKEYIGTSAVVQDINADMYSSSGHKVGYLIGCWWWSADALMKVENKFNPKPGDKIICNNGEEFICCKLNEFELKGIGSYLKDEPCTIFGISENWEKDYSWMYWKADKYPNDHEWEIREVIPAQKEEIVSDKEEPKYTVEDIYNAFSTLKWETTSYQKLIEELNKVSNPEYQEYLRLKAIYE